MSKIAIRYKASPTHGMGHMVRQLHLGKALINEGHSVTYFIDNFKPSIEAQAGLDYHIIQPTEIFLKQGDNVDLVILDQKENEAEYLRNLRPHTRKIVDFEDLGEGRNLVDLLIDCNLEKEDAKNINANIKTLFGLPYTILHPDFERYNQQVRYFPSAIKSALLTLGGTDPKNLTVPLAKIILEQSTAPSLTILIGSGFRDWQALEKLQYTWSQVQVRHNISDMAATLFHNDVVFCSGGVTLHEAMAVGTPAIVLNQVPHQEKKAKYFENLGAAINLGLAENWDTQQVVKALALKQSQMEIMSQTGKKLIDGKGLYRVMSEINKFLQ